GNSTLVPYLASANTFTNNNVFNGNLTVDGTTFFVNSNTDRVGIGTTAPGANLHVNGSTGAIIETPNNNEAVLTVRRSEVPGRNIIFYPAMWDGTSIYQQISFNGGGGTYPRAEFVGASRYYFDGNVGIGTTSPGSRLDVKSDIRANWLNGESDYFRVAGGAIQGLAIWENGETGEVFIGNEYNNDMGDIHFATKVTTDSNNIKMTIQGNGNVGIGTTSPQTKLHVNGSAIINGTLIGLSNATDLTGAVTLSQLQALSAGTFGAVTGSGTAWYIPMWNGTTSLNNSAIYQLGSNIGIGTTTPSHTFEVSGTFNISNSQIKTYMEAGALVVEG
ncbi:MAG: hypothetical protein KKC03_13015, partial [Bacteroidetes bacterium]|nr:hypothetical protein [Bacteroidota bacterium]